MENVHFGVLLLLGIGLFGGALGAWLFQKIRFPQVIGYIIMGIIIGEPVLKIVKQTDIIKLQPFNWFALGIIGFLVGGELKISTFKKYGKQFFSILIGEGFGAFFLVSIPITIFMFYVTGSYRISLAAGIVFGAISSATDPASTVDVLWEYRAKGVLTTALIAVVALDDALAMVLYGIGTSIAEILSGNSVSMIKEILHIFSTLFGAILLGTTCGFLLKFIVSFFHYHKEKMLAFAIGMLLLVIGFSSAFDIDVILVTMTMGFVIINFAPKKSQEIFLLVRSFSTPIYVMFFVLVGARLSISNMPLWLWGVVLIYVFGRSIGKVVGAYLGAKRAKADIVVQKYIGMGLFAQGGVAIGLSIMASHHLAGMNVTDTMSLGDMVIFVVTSTTLLVQIIGPAMVKLSIRLAKEINRNVTEKDIINSLNVSKVMEKNILIVKEHENINYIFELFSSNDFFVYPVVNQDNQIVGVITLENLKDILNAQDCWDWLVAEDVMIPVQKIVLSASALHEAMEIMEDMDLEQLPVVENLDSMKPIGILDVRRTKKIVKQELIKQQTESSD